MTPERQDTADLDGVLTWNLVRVARLVGQRLADRLSDLHLTPIHFGVLAHLANDSATTQAELARSVLVRPQSIAPLLDALEERGWVSRSDTRTRGRRNPVQITDTGRQILSDAWSIAIDANDLDDLGLDLAASRQLNRLLLAILQTTDGARPRPTDDLWRP